MLQPSVRVHNGVENATSVNIVQEISRKPGASMFYLPHIPGSRALRRMPRTEETWIPNFRFNWDGFVKGRRTPLDSGRMAAAVFPRILPSNLRIEEQDSPARVGVTQSNVSCMVGRQVAD